MHLLLNYGNIEIEKEINDLLQKLKKFALYEKSKDDIKQLAECIAKIHSYNLSQSNLPIYNAQWVIDLVQENNEYRSDVISALKIMAEMEYYSADIEFKIKDKKFLAWDISRANWHNDYKTGHVGSYIWDIAVIINYVENPSFSDTFLESYIQHGGQKPTLLSIYANLYYVKVAEAVINDNFKNVIIMTNAILKQNMFMIEIIANETLSRLGIVGF